MLKKIRISCSNCNARYIIDPKQGRQWGLCSQCNERFILPIPCPSMLIDWAKSTTWRRLTRFVKLSGARGHSLNTIDQLIEVVNNRRWLEENKTYLAASETGRILSQQEKIWLRSERKLQRKSILDEVRSFTPGEFEKLIADIFSSQGMIAQAVGGTADNGIDVKISDQEGEFWAIAQCKRYSENNKIGASQIRDFAGAFMLSRATKGFFFSTSSYTRHAKRTARGYPWLTIYDGQSFVHYIEELKYKIDREKI